MRPKPMIPYLELWIAELWKVLGVRDAGAENVICDGRRSTAAIANDRKDRKAA